MNKTRTEFDRSRTLKRRLKQSLTEYRARKVFGPFDTPEAAMDFLTSSRDMLIYMEKALREAALLGRRYDARKLQWLLHVDTVALDRKVRQSEAVYA